MAIAFDAATEAVRTGTTDPHTFDHTPSGTPRGVAVAVIYGGGTTDYVIGVTYGGAALTRVVTITDDAGETGRSQLWFLGSSIPTGTQTVSVDLNTATTVDMHIVCVTLTADADTEVIDFGSIDEDRANPSVALTYGGRAALALAAHYYGGGSPSTAGANCTLVHNHDLGAWGSTIIRQTTPGSADFTAAFTAASDDCAMVAMAVAEVVGGEPPAATPVRVQRRMLLGVGSPFVVM